MRRALSPAPLLAVSLSFGLSFALPLVAATPAHAEGSISMREAAKRFFQAGQVLYDRGKFKETAAQFELAFGEQPLAAFAYNIAQAYDKAGDREKSAAAYKKYLEFKESKEDAAQVKARLEVLERELAEATKAAAAAAAAAKAAAAPERARRTPLPYKEPVTGHIFQTFLDHEGRDFVLVGVGTRKVFGFKVYAMAMYLDEEPARKAFPKLAGQAGGADNKTLLESNLVSGFITQGEFAKHALLWFARDVSMKQTQESYREALAADLSQKANPDVRKAAEDFVAMFDKDVKEGEEIVIHTEPDGRVGVQMPGGPLKWGPASLRLVHQVWDIWLGAKPINGDLKKALMDRVDGLGR